MNVFQKSDIPDVVIKSGQIGDISIKQNGYVFELYENDLPWMFYDPRPNKKVGLQEQFAMYDLAYGKVVITGFGFGVLLNWLCKKPQITEITIIEKSKEVVDLYLLNNKLPSNKKVNIIYADANTYANDQHYDCLLLDHLDHEPDMLGTSRQIAKNIKHNLLWLWPLEFLYVRQMFGIERLWHYHMFPAKYPQYDLGSKWNDFLKQINIPTIPNITEEQIVYYINVYANNIDKGE